MQHRVVGLFHMLWDAELKVRCNALKRPLAKYQRAVWFKANPRNESYMRSLFEEHYPEGAFINVDKEIDWVSQVKEADAVILLYPDAIGLGYSGVEKIVGHSRKSWASIRVLNGRKRDFLLNFPTRLGLKVRRMLEQSMLLEFTLLLPFIVMTPLLLAFDLIRGHR